MSNLDDNVPPHSRLMKRLIDNPNDNAIRVERIVLEKAVVFHAQAIEQIKALQKEIEELKKASMHGNETAPETTPGNSGEPESV